MEPQAAVVKIGVIREIEEHARACRPSECCGLLAGDAHTVARSYRLRNEACRPEARYFAAPEDLLKAMRQIREAGETLMGIYHSHPKAPAYPSPSDVELALYPDVFYFIISLEPEIDTRAFRIDRGQVRAAPIQIISNEA